MTKVNYDPAGPRVFRLSVWYASTPDGPPAQTSMLNAYEASYYVNSEVGFMSDLLFLEGDGVRKLTLEYVPPRATE